MNVWDILGDKEIDFYFPDHNFAIEANGDYWHNNKPEGYHKDKTDRCAEKGIELWHIWQSEWYNNKEFWINKIQSRLNGDKSFTPELKESIFLSRF